MLISLETPGCQTADTLHAKQLSRVMSELLQSWSHTSVWSPCTPWRGESYPCRRWGTNVQDLQPLQKLPAKAEMDSEGKLPSTSKCQCTSTTSSAYRILCLLETNPRSHRQSRLLRETEGCLLRLIRMVNGWAAGWTGKNKLPDILPSAIQKQSLSLFSPLSFAKPEGFKCLTFRT